jgi:signal transduction histidine kinase
MAMLQLGFHYIFNDSEKAWEYIIASEELSRQQKITYGIVNALSVKGIYYDVTGSLDSARHYFAKGHKLSQSHNFPDLEVKFVNSLGMNSWNRGHYNTALGYFFKVLEINENLEAGQRIPLSTPYNNIGLIYQELSLYEKALAYHYKALDYRQKDNKLIAQVATSFNNIGICLAHLDKYQEAEKAYRDGIEVTRKHNFLRQYYDLAANLANTLVAMKRYEEALKFNLEILRNDTQLMLPEKFLMNIYGATAGIYVQLAQPRKAIQYIENGLKIIEKNMDVEFYASDLFKYAALAYYMTGNLEKGKHFSNEMATVIEKKFSKKNAESMAEMEVKYQTALKDNEILKLQKEKEEAELKIALAELQKNRRERIIYLTIGIAFIMLLASWIWYRWNRLKTRTLEEQKLNNAIFLSEQNERVRIARDIHDSIGQKLSVQKMMLSCVREAIGEQWKKELDHASHLLDETVSELRNISHNLIPQELNLGLMKALEETAENINDAGKVNISVTISENSQEADKISVNHQLSIYRIVQEILGNMIRHSQASNISIVVHQPGDILHFSISDNGRGFDIRKVNQSDGIGWKNILARARLISAKLNISSVPDTGTMVELSVPLK